MHYSFPSPSSTSLKVVDHFVYLGFSRDSKLLMHCAVTGIIEKAKKAHNCVAAVSYSLRYGKNDYNPVVSNSPSDILTLWKSTVMPHFTLYLRYLRLDSQIQSLQTELNNSLRRTLRVYGIDSALLTEVGILPLRYIQKVQLSQLCYRL